MIDKTESNKLNPNTTTTTTTNPNPNRTTMQPTNPTKPHRQTPTTNPTTTAMQTTSPTKPPSTTMTTTNTTARPPKPADARTKAQHRTQRILNERLPWPLDQNATRTFSGTIAAGEQWGLFAHRIAADGRSLIYYFAELSPTPFASLALIDAGIAEAESLSDQSRIPGVLEVPTPGGRTLRFPITPTPVREVAEPALTKNTI